MYNRVIEHESEVKNVLNITEVITEAKELIENLKKLPPEKQEYVNGYVQGVADSIAEQKQPT